MTTLHDIDLGVVVKRFCRGGPKRRCAPHEFTLIAEQLSLTLK